MKREIEKMSKQLIKLREKTINKTIILNELLLSEEKRRDELKQSQLL
jgi:hypothetical protein